MSSSPPDGESKRTGPRGRWSALPLRTKLIGIFTIVIVAVSVTIGAITQAVLTRYLTDRLDQQVIAASMRLAGPRPGDQQPGRLEPGDTKPGTSGAQASEPTYPANTGGKTPYSGENLLCDSSLTIPNGLGGRQPDDSIFAVYTKTSGTPTISAVARGTYPSCKVLTGTEADALTTVPADDRITTVDLGEYGTYRVTAQTFEGTTFVSGLSTASISATRAQLITILAAVTGSAIVLGGIAVWWSVRRSLVSLEQVATTAKSVTALPLHRGEVDLAVRVPPHLTDPRTEAGTVGAALNQLLEHVEEALTAREQSEGRVRRFVADASHELRTPLTAIRGYAELAGRHPDDLDGVRHALARVQAESQRMSALVEDLLLLARLDAGRPLTVAPVDLTALAVEAVADARVAAPDHRWVVGVPDHPVLAAGDSARLHQILANLLTNARVHTPAGTTVTVDVEADGASRVVLRVRDDGPGVPPEIRDSVFGRFVRGDTSRSREAHAGGSTGLGLAIVASLVQAHSGSIALDSDDSGTVLTVTLPRAADDGHTT